MGDCISCGIETLNIKTVQWQQYAKVVAGQKGNGEDWKVT
jgi:hypothetical protein